VGRTAREPRGSPSGRSDPSGSEFYDSTVCPVILIRLTESGPQGYWSSARRRKLI